MVDLLACILIESSFFFQLNPTQEDFFFGGRSHAYAIHLRMPSNRRALCSALWPLQFPREAATLWDLLKIASLGCGDCVSEFFPFQGSEDPERVLEIRVLPSHGRTPAFFSCSHHRTHGYPSKTSNTLLGTDISQDIPRHFEDDFPLPKVWYVSSLNWRHLWISSFRDFAGMGENDVERQPTGRTGGCSFQYSQSKIKSHWIWHGPMFNHYSFISLLTAHYISLMMGL